MTRPTHDIDRWRPLGFALVALLLLSRCASITPPESVQTSAHIAQLQRLENWQLDGKLGLRLPDDNGSARIRWRQRAEHYELSLSGPLGQGRVDISGAPGEVVLHQGDEPPVAAASAEALVYRATGWQLPVTALRHWVLGVPSPAGDYQSLSANDKGLATAFSQYGWQLRFQRYRDVGGIALPGHIIAQRAEGEQNVRLVLAIHQWETGLD